MSDFLTRLAQRAQGQALLAQPWIAPRFAQGPDLVSPLDGTAPPQEPGSGVAEEASVWRRLLEQPQFSLSAPPVRPQIPRTPPPPRGGAR